ncbi:protein NO VEIN domain-containing protein [uncultured Clostridium sp.]|uniref:protein NO VEIN domain-containing protein n=1 Tax=uncultured Clostridium sp. TaxID=59620 RepID=UPI003217ECAA
MYTIPDEFYFRVHHVRPRFKGDIENVLIYMATEVSKVSELPTNEFNERVNAAIQFFPGNSHRKIKTINNWRTEISALFGFIISEDGITKPGLRAIELASNQDLIESFKVFLFNFQYPGGHIKPHETLKMVEVGIRFKPAQYILKLLQYAEKESGKRIGLTKAEATHCIFNDLRCTRDNENVDLTWERIKQNREDGVEYDQTGDIIRYAGDIIDYMEIANLLVTHDNKNYYINNLETEAILKFVNSTHWFDKYDHMIENKSAQLTEIKNCQKQWFDYVNRDISDTDFQTDILALIANNSEEYDKLKKVSFNLLEEKLKSADTLATKDIGDIGESLIHGHECERIRIGGRADLIHLIKRIPTQFAVGYDIQSVELDEKKRYIEVKTTISSKPLHFNKVHLTPNEWNTADSMKDRYFVYRLMVSKQERKLFVLQDPVGLYKNDKIQMVPRDGADIVFDTKVSGTFEELLA